MRWKPVRRRCSSTARRARTAPAWRRIVQPELAADIHRALTDEGVWRIATDIEDYALHVHEVMDGLGGFHNDGALTVSLPVEHVGKGNADEAAALRHADFAESERFDGRVFR